MRRTGGEGGSVGRTGRHGKVDLGLGHEVDIGLDKTSRLSLADERRRGGDDGLRARDVHDLEEEPSTERGGKKLFVSSPF